MVAFAVESMNGTVVGAGLVGGRQALQAKGANARLSYQSPGRV